MVGAEHRAQVAHPRAAAFYAFLVKVVTKYIHAVRAGQVVTLVAVQIGGSPAAGRNHKRSGIQVLADEAAELERHPVARRELQVGDLVLDFVGLPHSAGKPFPIEVGQAPESRPPLFANMCRGVVGAEKPLIVILVVGHQSREPACPPRVAGERTVLSARELQAQPYPAAEQHHQAKPKDPPPDGACHTNPPCGNGITGQ